MNIPLRQNLGNEFPTRKPKPWPKLAFAWTGDHPMVGSGHASIPIRLQLYSIGRTPDNRDGPRTPLECSPWPPLLFDRDHDCPDTPRVHAYPRPGVELDDNALADKINHDWKSQESYDQDDGSVVDW